MNEPRVEAIPVDAGFSNAFEDDPRYWALASDAERRAFVLAEYGVTL